MLSVRFGGGAQPMLMLPHSRRGTPPDPNQPLPAASGASRLLQYRRCPGSMRSSGQSTGRRPRRGRGPEGRSPVISAGFPPKRPGIAAGIGRRRPPRRAEGTARPALDAVLHACATARHPDLCCAGVDPHRFVCVPITAQEWRFRSDLRAARLRRVRRADRNAYKEEPRGQMAPGSRLQRETWNQILIGSCSSSSPHRT